MYPWLVPLLAALANALLGVIVFRHGPRQSLNRLFCLVTATIVSWNLNLFSLYFIADPDTAHYWSTVFRTGTLIMPAAVAHLFLLFGDRWRRFSMIYPAIAYTLVTGLVVANAFNLLTYGVRPHVWGHYPVVTPIYSLHVVSVATNFMVAAVAMIANVAKAPNAQKRLQATFWLLGAGIGMVGGITNLLPLYHVQIYPIGNVANVPYTAIVAYAIVRHRLLDIDIVLTKGLSYAIAALSIMAPSVLLVIGMQRWAFGTVNYDFTAAILLLFLIVGSLFPGFRSRTETQIEQSFFRDKYDYRRTLRAFSKNIIRILDPDKLVEEIGHGLGRIIDPTQLTIYLQVPNHPVLRSVYHQGVPTQAHQFRRTDPFVKYLAHRSESVLRDEIDASIGATEGTGFGRVFEANGWSVCVPLVISGEIVGFLGLGQKRSGEAFAAVDLDLLDTLAAQAATAFENARLSDELHRSRDIIHRAGRMSALGTLAAGIAHEIRNPLVSIQTFFQLAPQRLHDEEFVTSFLGLAENEVRRIGDLVTELLTFARSNTQNLLEVDIGEAIDGTLRLLSAQAHRHQVKLLREGGESLPNIKADPDRIKQVLVNIVLNAIQATTSGGLVSVGNDSVEVGGQTFGRIWIRDTGAGIPAHMREDIFNPFFTTKDKGTGLGLSIAYQIISDYGGFISVESSEGEGTTFFIHLPLRVNTRHEGWSDRMQLASGK